MESKDLWVEFEAGRPGHMVLRGTYGDKIHQAFHMTRQGVRWRFHRLFNDVYVSAFDYGEWHVMHSTTAVSRMAALQSLWGCT